jgi:hypothetical protein
MKRTLVLIAIFCSFEISPADESILTSSCATRLDPLWDGGARAITVSCAASDDDVLFPPDQKPLPPYAVPMLISRDRVLIDETATEPRRNRDAVPAIRNPSLTSLARAR